MKIPPGISIGDRFVNPPAVWEVTEKEMVCIESGHGWSVGEIFDAMEPFITGSYWQHISSKTRRFKHLYDKLNEL